jgi:hypothetical protein
MRGRRCGDRRNVSLDIFHAIPQRGNPETFRLSPCFVPLLVPLLPLLQDDWAGGKDAETPEIGNGKMEIRGRIESWI